MYLFFPRLNLRPPLVWYILSISYTGPKRGSFPLPLLLLSLILRMRKGKSGDSFLAKLFEMPALWTMLFSDQAGTLHSRSCLSTSPQGIPGIRICAQLDPMGPSRSTGSEDADLLPKWPQADTQSLCVPWPRVYLSILSACLHKNTPKVFMNYADGTWT